MGSQSSQSVFVTSGDSSNTVGVIHGDVNYYTYYGTNQSGSDHVDFDCYRASIRKKFSEWKSKYTMLDLSPVLSTVNNDLKPIDGAERTLTQAVIQSRRLVILGGAGTGKTTSLRFLAYSITSDPDSLNLANGKPDACLLIDLTRFRLRENLAPLESIIVLLGEILHTTSETAPPSLTALHNFLSSVNLALLFDGLNEVPIDARTICLRGLLDLAEKYPQHKCVIATRPHRFRPIDGWEMGVIRNLRETQIKDFLVKYTDAEAGESLARMLRNNRLARVPLFLSYIAAICRAESVAMAIVSSRSKIVGSYIKVLLDRDVSEDQRAHYFQNASMLESALIVLAETSNFVGQSIPFRDAVSLLTERNDVNPETASSIIEELLTRTLVVRDGQYIRFWHQTIQEYFYAASVVSVWRGNGGKNKFNKRSAKRAFAAADEQGPLVYVPYFLNDVELRLVIDECLKWNVSLTISWLDDLCFEHRRPDLILSTSKNLRRIALAARRYSRLIKKRWHRYVVLLASLYFLLFPFAGTFIILDFTPIAIQISIAVGIFLLWSVWLVDVIRTPPTSTLEQILVAAFRVRNADLRASLAAIAGEVSRSRLTAFLQKSTAASIAKTGAEDNAFMLLRNSPSLLTGLRLLGRVPDEVAYMILEFCLRYKNRISEIAMDSLAERASRFPSEREQIGMIASKVYDDTTLEWGFTKRAKKCMLASGIALPTRISWFASLRRSVHRSSFGSRVTKAGLAFLCCVGLYTATVWPFMVYSEAAFRGTSVPLIHSSTHSNSRADFTTQQAAFRTRYQKLTRLELIQLLVMGGFGAFLYLRVKKTSKGVEGMNAWKWALSGTVFYISVPAFYFYYQDKIRRDAIPFEWAALEQHLAKHYRTLG